MYVFTGSTLIERLSSFDRDYYCIIEKVEFLPGIIRVYIDERGDNSLGPLQDPRSSRLGIVNETSLTESKTSIDGKFSVSDASRQYCGYLDFPMENSFLKSEHIIGFRYGSAGYTTVKLFRFNEELIDRFSEKPMYDSF